MPFTYMDQPSSETARDSVHHYEMSNVLEFSQRNRVTRGCTYCKELV